jgi:environmental stress-induced protein Ves
MEISDKPKQQIKWSGGTSSEWLIFPKEASYLDRNFLLRISTATVEQSPISFTDLPGFTRYILLDKGECMLTVNGVKSPLSSKELFYFSGADEVHSLGIYNDFNCIFSEQLKLKVSLHVIADKTNMYFPPASAFVFCLEGCIEVEHQMHQAPCCVDLTENQTSLSLSVQGRIICAEFL